MASKKKTPAPAAPVPSVEFTRAQLDAAHQRRANAGLKILTDAELIPLLTPAN